MSALRQCGLMVEGGATEVRETDPSSATSSLEQSGQVTDLSLPQFICIMEIITTSSL